MTASISYTLNDPNTSDARYSLVEDLVIERDALRNVSGAVDGRCGTRQEMREAINELRRAEGFSVFADELDEDIKGAWEIWSALA